MPKLKTDTPVNEAIGSRLQELREEAKKTTKQMARMLDISIVSYNKMELERCNFNLARLMQLAEAYGVTVNDLLNMPPTPRKKTARELEDENREKDALIKVLQAENERLLSLLGMATVGDGHMAGKKGKR